MLYMLELPTCVQGTANTSLVAACVNTPALYCYCITMALAQHDVLYDALYARGLVQTWQMHSYIHSHTGYVKLAGVTNK